ncbi:hypothetical protein LMG3458_02565 [Achromobacter deleyi]|uniref:Fimbrial-type adhesion domain-containing protein n=2 Tax=Achromobacter deleyi TaxID=1353891 RepID=A0A6S7A084_9BURK|nr:hypothetical protein LMG3458_02565 [Achromobacter deleyi]CAB3851771.1 hypothetical protein LMG3481_01799 [Achromobacter deleyi]CAB3867923.1 hypothetical protein LMG3412_02599 [Achromobacter deleyi]CAB3874563.1 hypothetical protein LMG3482_02967 [Achromobacter deleyi]
MCGAGFPLPGWAAPFSCGAQTVGVSVAQQTRTAVTFLLSQASSTDGAQPWVTLYTADNRMLRSVNGAAVQCQVRGGGSCTAVYRPDGAMRGQVWAGASVPVNTDHPASHSWCSGPVNIDINPTPAGCQATAGGDRTISIGQFTVGHFRSVGATTPSKVFNLGLSCVAGTSVGVTVSSDRVLDASRGLLGVSGGAAGVAIQLLDGANNVVPLGTMIDHGSQGPGWDLVYSARYYQVSSHVTPGDANGMVTITLQYR